MSSSKVTSLVVGSFGRLWGRGHESFAPELRRILSVSGKGATTFLQGLVTSDLLSPPTPPRPEPLGDEQPGVPKRLQKTEDNMQDIPRVEFNEQLRSTCFLDNKGRIVSDSLLWKMDEHQYYIDCPGSSADELLQHLKQYKLRRSKVKIEDLTNIMSSHAVFGTLNVQGAPPGFVSGMDPRHPSLGLRILRLPTTAAADKNDDDSTTSSAAEDRRKEFAEMMSDTFPDSPGNYELVRRLAGVAEGAEIQGKVALECNEEFFNAISFSKGCYLGQELTARVHHTGVLRKRVMPLLLLDPYMEVPMSWSLASSLQEGRAKKRFTARELKQLPSRLPRLSVLTAGNLVAVTTGSVMPDGEAIDEAAKNELEMVQKKAETMLQEIETSCRQGAKIVDSKDGKTIGQIVSPPMEGTNVVLALMRLESVGLLSGGIWSKTNKVKIGDSKNDMRYLPYLPLWWPEIDSATGKAKEESDELETDDPEACEEDEEGSTRKWKLPRIEFEEVPINDEEEQSKNA